MNLEQLSVNEKILLAEQLWDSVRGAAEQHRLTDAQKAELDHRLAAYELDRDAGDSWENIRERILSA
jgi:putative addiction module component (TIGR02574 family)